MVVFGVWGGGAAVGEEWVGGERGGGGGGAGYGWIAGYVDGDVDCDVVACIAEGFDVGDDFVELGGKPACGDLTLYTP